MVHILVCLSSFVQRYEYIHFHSSVVLHYIHMLPFMYLFYCGWTFLFGTIANNADGNILVSVFWANVRTLLFGIWVGYGLELMGHGAC